jgi:hypothetical protein
VGDELVGQGDRVLGGLGVDVGQGAGEAAAQGADGVKLPGGGMRAHGVSVELFGVRVVSDGRVEYGDLFGGLTGQGVGQGEVGVQGLLAEGFAVGLDPFVVGAVGEVSAVGVDGAAQRLTALVVGVGGSRVVDGVAQAPQVDVDLLRVEDVAVVGVGDVAARAGGAAQDGAQVGDVGVEPAGCFSGRGVGQDVLENGVGAWGAPTATPR